MARVSVVLPVYNGARFIGEAVESVRIQRYIDWELIIVNDGSTDTTLDILTQFISPRILVVNQSNLGAATARNVGLKYAKGEYVAFLDADDMYLPNALFDLADYLDVHESVDVVFSNGYVCDGLGRRLMDLADLRPGVYSGFILDQIVLDPQVVSFPVCTLSRRETICSNGVEFDPQLSPSEDWDFWIQLACHARFDYLDKHTCIYRLHGGNTTSVTKSQERRDDLVRGRLKIMREPWFGDLAVGTRYKFFYQLLIVLLSGDTGKQQDLLDSTYFKEMPLSAQASICRLIATEYLAAGVATKFVRFCLERSTRLYPKDFKSNLLWSLMQVSVPLCRGAVSSWKMLHRTYNHFASLGQHSPRTLPDALLLKS